MILFNTAYWSGLLEWLKRTMVDQGNIAPEDLNLLYCTDDTDEAVRLIVDCYERNCWEPPVGKEAKRARSTA